MVPSSFGGKKSTRNIKNLKYKFCCYDTVTLRSRGKIMGLIQGVLVLISDNIHSALLLNN